MSKYKVIIYWSMEDDCFIAEVRELKLITTHGDTLNKALQNPQEVIQLWLEVAQEEVEISEPKGKLMYAWYPNLKKYKNVKYRSSLLFRSL